LTAGFRVAAGFSKPEAEHFGIGQVFPISAEMRRAPDYVSNPYCARSIGLIVESLTKRLQQIPV
jgi:hypothetical protein